MNIIKPIFILGAARSGTSIYYKTFVKHKDTAYLEHYSNMFYKKSFLFPTIPILFRYREMRFGKKRPKQTEGLVWNRFAKFYDYLIEKDVTKEIRDYYESVIKYELKAFKATRFVNKNPKHSLRLRWLNEMFPDAFYIIIKRDPKAAVASYTQKIYNFKKSYPKRISPYDDLLKKFNDGKIGINACINFHKYVTNHLNEDLPLVKQRTIEVDYRELVNDTQSIMKKNFEFCELEWYKDLEEIIPKALERGNDEKWKKLPEEDQELLLKAFPN